VSPRWDPWDELRHRPHVVVELIPLPGDLGAFYLAEGDDAAVMIDPGLTRRQRRAALAHELVHDERRVLARRAVSPALMAKEESLVRAEVARRLVPVDELADLAAVGEPLEVWEVADRFDVPEDLVRSAVQLLNGRISAGEGGSVHHLEPPL
jgi:hypothetical protein